MEVKETAGSSAYQVHLHMALDEAISSYQEAHEAVSRHAALTEEIADTSRPAH